MNFVLCSAFSLNMVQREGVDVALRPITVEAARNLLTNETVTPAIGHPDTARLVANVLGYSELSDEWAEIALSRPNVSFDSNTSLIVAQYTGPRLPAGTTELPEGAVIEFWQVYTL